MPLKPTSSGHESCETEMFMLAHGLCNSMALPFFWFVPFPSLEHPVKLFQIHCPSTSFHKGNTSLPSDAVSIYLSNEGG